MRSMADVGDDFLLVIAPEWVERVGYVILRREDVDPMLPELLGAGYTSPYWLLVVTTLYHEADMRITANAYISLFEQVHYLVSMHFVIGRQCSAMAGGNPPLILFAHRFHGKIL